jgi:hypothetical protein
VSFGEGCAKKKYPGVYGRVQSASSWIREVRSFYAFPKFLTRVHQSVMYRLLLQILDEGVECVDYAYDCCVKTWENDPYPELGQYYENPLLVLPSPLIEKGGEEHAFARILVCLAVSIATC